MAGRTARLARDKARRSQTLPSRGAILAVPPTRTPAPFLRGCLIGLIVLPFALLVFVAARYAIAVPYLNQWELVPLLEKAYAS